jgi:hypothetical protein
MQGLSRLIDQKKCAEGLLIIFVQKCTVSALDYFSILFYNARGIPLTPMLREPQNPNNMLNPVGGDIESLMKQYVESPSNIPEIYDLQGQFLARARELIGEGRIDSSWGISEAVNVDKAGLGAVLGRIEHAGMKRAREMESR